LVVGILGTVLAFILIVLILTILWSIIDWLLTYILRQYSVCYCQYCQPLIKLAKKLQIL
jgi:hypothetical protein